MENQQQEFLNKTEIGKSNEFIVGPRKYEQLKSVKIEDLTDEEKAKIDFYESKIPKPDPMLTEKNNSYLKELLNPVEQVKFSINAKQLWELFKANFETVNGKPFQIIEGITLENLKPLIYYFSKDNRFYECENLSKISQPSFDKGLLIIGNFGNGKTSTMKVFEQIFKGVPGIGFKGFSANEVVTIFEKCSTELARDEFEKRMWRGIRYFDDLKTERIASNFGKVNIFKEIIEERYNRKSKTYVTCNFKKDFPNDLNAALDEFEDKYESRVYDRLYEMFNIIEFKGKSFRK